MIRLLAITPPAAVAPRIDVGCVDAWLAAGAGPDPGRVPLAVLLREPGADAAAILADRRLWPLREALERAGIPTLVSVDPNTSSPERLLDPSGLGAGLGGVQLRGDPSAAQVAAWRRALGPEPLIGRSVHGLEPHPAPAASYACLAPIYPPQTLLPGERKHAIGLEGLRRWTTATPGIGPILALGGVSAGTAAACLAAGAEGLAGIRLFFGPRPEARHNVAALVRAIAATMPPADASQPPPRA